MKNRIIFGAVMIVVMAGLLSLDAWLDAGAAGASAGYATYVRALPLAAIVVLLTILGFVELSRLARSAGTGVLRASGLLAAIALGLSPLGWRWLGRPAAAADTMLLLGLLSTMIFAEQMFRFRIEDALRRLGATMLAVVYLGVGMAIMFQIRLEYGLPMLVLFLAAVKCTDIGAYFTGTAIGKHKMIPWLSPGKSWEGLIGGLVAAASVSALLSMVMHIDSLPPIHAAWFGALVGGVGQFADLCESLLKRSAAVKDSGAVVPGFGGVLDIIDSPLLSAPTAYIVLRLLVG